jgi:hypothetical protein
MHYDDEEVYKAQRLLFVAYKHSTPYPHRKNKNGSTNRNSVDYVVTSIRECHLFPPYTLTSIIKESYEFLDPVLKDEPYEHFFLIEGEVRKNESTKVLEVNLKMVLDASAIKRDSQDRDETYFVH